MSSQDSVQKFFRVYLPNVTDHDMYLPSFWEDISVTHLPRKVTVKSVSSGNVWIMEMTTTNDESDTVFLRDGWKKIVKDENLKELTILVFEFDGSREFHFCLYDHGSMCKRMRSPNQNEVIQVESDDEEESEETDEDMIVEDDEESTEGLDESLKRKERGGTSRRLKTGSVKFEEYLDYNLNPAFPINTIKQQTRIPLALIKDYNLKFPEVVIVRDELGKLKRKISVWKNRTVTLKGFISIMRRNHVKPRDKVVCELKMVSGYQGLVREVKVHIIRG